MLEQPAEQGVEGLRAAEEVALSVVATQLAQPPVLTYGLDALGDGEDVERLRERDGGGDDRRVVGALQNGW